LGNVSPLVLALSAIIGILAVLTLAALGWGGIAAFASHPARVALAVVTVALTAAALRTRGNLSSGVREDRADRRVLPVFAVLGALLAFLPAWCDRLGILVLDGDAVRWLGVAVFAAGGVLRLWPIFVLGERFSGLVAIQPGHALVTDGVYGIVRHPSYLGLLVAALGWALTFRSGVGVLIALLLAVPLAMRIRAEERLLRDHFGAAYIRYSHRTWRLLPGLW
jgi:protein-S-isoprenylcysteine O-methyltransferase Ste14